MIITKTATAVCKIRFTCIFLISFLCIQLKTSAQNVSVSGAVSGNGSYPTLKAAFAAINGAAQTAANINVSILANTTETASAILNTGAWASLSVTPSGGASRAISGNFADALVTFYGADNVYINGLNTGGNSLEFSNSNTGNISTSTLLFMVDATSNTVTNCSILGSSTSSVLGTVTFSIAAPSGNNNNVISNCNIGPAGSNLPANGIYSIGNSGNNNSNNLIQNCNVYDYFNAALPSCGISLSDFNSAWTITDSRFYQSAVRTATATGVEIQHSAIRIFSGNAHNIINNVIGYSSPSATGVYSLNLSSSSIAFVFYAIDLSVGTTTATSIQGNTLTAINAQANATGNQGFYTALSGIKVAAGSFSIGNASPNIFGGASGVDLIKCTGGPRVKVISGQTTGNVYIQNNIIGGITSVHSNSTIGTQIFGIHVGAVNMVVSGNTIGNSTANNIRCGYSGITNSNSGVASGIQLNYTGAVGTVAVSNNTVQNITTYCLDGYSIASGVTTEPYYDHSTTYSITSNLIRNISISRGNQETSSGNSHPATGINVSCGGSNVIANNTVSAVSIVGTASVSAYACGIYHNIGNDTRIYNNYISNITNSQGATTSTAPSSAVGIQMRMSSGSVYAYNNFISLGSGNADNTAYIGMQTYESSSGFQNNYIYHNTINIEGTVGSGLLPTIGYYRGDFTTYSSSVTVTFRNNLVTNTRSGGFGSHYAIANDYGAAGTSTVGWAATASNYNVLNANAATIGYWGGNQTFANWKTASGGDANSYSGIPVTYVNSAANDLHLNMGTTPTSIESGGQTISSVTVDIDGQTRPGPAGFINGGGIRPDIGADEFDGVPVDIVPPTITYNLLAGICSASDRTLNATVTDNYGVPITGTLQPHIYFKKNSGSYVSSQGVLTTGTHLSGTWNFTISMSALGGVADGDIISYFIVAQDKASPVNVTANPAPGFTGTGVNAVSVPPTITTQTIQVKFTPTLTVNSGTICSGTSFTIVPAGASTYIYSGGSAIVSPGSNVNYTVTGTSALGCTATAISSVVVNATPVVNVNSGAFCSGQSFTIIPGGAFTYTISGGSFIVSPATTTFYTVSGTSTAGCISSNTATSTVTVNITPTISVNSGVMCSGNSFTLSPTGANTYVYPAGGAVVSPAANTSYSITGVSAQGCASANTAISSVTVYTSPTVSVNSGSICSGNSFTLAGNGAATYNYQGGSAIVSPTVNTSYNVLGTSAEGCISTNVAVAHVSVSASPTISVNSGSVCSGNSYTIVPVGAATYTISGGSMVVSPAGTTSYTINGTSGAGCISTNSAIAQVSVSASPTISVNSGSVCSGNSFTLVPSGAFTYTISGGSDVVTPATTTTYSVSGTSADGCATLNGALSTITVAESPTLTVTSTGFTVICEGETFTLTASGASQYNWSNGGTTNNIVITPSISTTYTVVGTNLNGCSKSLPVAQNVEPCIGIKQTPANSISWAVYPNPNNGQFSIESTSETGATIVNTLGQVISLHHLNEGKNKIDLGEQPKGVYFILLKQSNKTIKVIKE